MSLLILVAFGLAVVAAIIRLTWRLLRGDIRIESSSEGRQLFGRDKRDTPT